jgi:hypothetical protein
MRAHHNLALEGTAPPICGKKSASQVTSMTCRRLDRTNLRRFPRRNTGEGFALQYRVTVSLVVGRSLAVICNPLPAWRRLPPAGRVALAGAYVAVSYAAALLVLFALHA